MRRREFIGLVGGAAAWPLGARAQQTVKPVIGFLHSRSLQTEAGTLNAFRQGLKETGFTEGQNVTIEYRWAEAQVSRLPQLAADLVQRRVAVIAALGGNNSTLAAKAATASIPIVFTSGADPVKSGLVPNLNRPGGNVTGVNFFVAELSGKGLGLLHELVPNAKVVGLVFNNNSPETVSVPVQMQKAAEALGLKLVIAPASQVREIAPAFANLKAHGVDMVSIPGDPLFSSQIEEIIGLAATHQLPTVYYRREWCVAGGLMSYGTSIADAYRQAGVYTGRILRGEQPGELPVVQSTKFELVLNLRTAKSLGLTVPNSMLLLADEVVE